MQWCKKLLWCLKGCRLLFMCSDMQWMIYINSRILQSLFVWLFNTFFPPLFLSTLFPPSILHVFLSPPLPPSLFSIRHFFKKKNYLVFALSANSRHFFIVHGSDLGFSGFPHPYLVCAILATSLCCSDEGRWCWKIARFEIRCVQWARCSETHRLVVK